MSAAAHDQIRGERGVSRPGGGWLYAPAVDLLIGAGVGYLLSVPLLAWLGAYGGMSSWPVGLAALFALLISGPHYGATLLRVYEQREDRRRYAFFSVWATLALCALFLLGLHEPFIGSLLVTAYASWSPWHFSGQNYGLALMFMRRRGIPVEAPTKRLLYASFVLSFGLSFLALHGATSGVAVASVPISKGSVFRFLSLEIPAPALLWMVSITAAAYLLCTVGAAVRLLRVASPRTLGPAVSLVLMQALWFGLPAASRVLASAPLTGLAFAVVWVSAAHGLQYLWVTSYYARREDPSRGVVPYFGKTLLAGSAVTVFPALVFAPGLLGSVPWDTGLAILVFSVVNLHHFILDGAIWKLRDGRVARLLLRESEPGRPAPPGPRPRRAWGRALALIGVVSLGVAGLDVWEREYVINRAGDDMDRVLRSAERLTWIGRDSPPLHTQVAGELARRGELDRASAEYRRSLELYPTPDAWVGLGRVYFARAEYAQATRAFEAALDLAADDLAALVHAGRTWMRRERPDLARAYLERAVALAPANPLIRREWLRATAAAARTPRAADEPASGARAP
jgi:cytochrome c-type biogenesis protein CcmH/NrfG